MEARGGIRRGSNGLGGVDALTIVFIILTLACALGALLARRDVRIVTQTQQWLRASIDHLSPSLFLPNQAAAEASPPSHPAAKR